MVWLLSRFLYRPVKDIIAKREAMAQQAFKQAEDREAAAESARQDLEQARTQLADERKDLLKKLHGELEDEREKVLAKAKSEADDLVDAARRTIAEERAAAVAELKTHAASLAVELAAEILKKSGAERPNGPFLDQLDERLGDLPAGEVERLRDDLSRNDAQLVVATAAPLEPGEQKTWTDRLGDRLKTPDGVAFVVDPDILGGAELRFPHAVFKLSWADQLKAAQQLLEKDAPAS